MYMTLLLSTDDPPSPARASVPEHLCVLGLPMQHRDM